MKVSENMIQYVTDACNGNIDAIAKLYTRTLKASYFLAETLSDSKSEAVDIVKKAYARAFCNIDKLKKPEAFEIWMKQNVAAVYKESKKFVFSDADAGAVENSSEFLPESVLENDELTAKIYKAVSDLRPELKTALVLHYNNGMPVQILAKFLGVSESTANALLGKARANVLEAAGIAADSTATAGALPVITRLFQRMASDVTIENTDVRDIFIYVTDEYRNSKPVQPVVESEPENEPEEKADETETVEDEISVQEDAPAEESEPEAVQPEEEKADEEPAASNVVMFTQKISKLFGDNQPAAEMEDISSGADKEEWAGETDDGEVTVPDFGAPVTDNSDSTVDEETIGNFGGISIDADLEDQTPVAEEKKADKSLKMPAILTKLNPKTIIIAVAAIVALIAVIFGISKLAGGNDTPDDSAYAWQAGGFAECTELGYLDENAAYFKSATTGKYGLIDYQGNVILQPNYDGFKRCGSGREYTDRDSYHTLVVIGNEEFEITVVNGVVTISENAHLYHSVPTEILEGVSYEERDRYFEGYAAARKNDKWGYVSQEKDKKVIPYEYEAVNDLTPGETSSCDYCRPVTGGLIAVKKDGKMGIINLDNDVVVPFEYSNIMPGSNGVFIACKDGVWGAILVGDAQTTFKGINITVETLPPEVTETPGEETLGKYKVVSDDGANVREGVGSDYDLLGELDYGDIVIGYETKKADNGNKWLKIKLNGEYGWVAMNMLEPVD